MFWSINNTSQEYNSLPSGWVRMKFLPRVMEKILISRDGKKILTLVAFGHAGKNFLTIT